MNTYREQSPRVINAIISQAEHDEAQATELQNFARLLLDRLDGFDGWLKNKLCMELMGQVQDVLIKADEDAAKMIMAALTRSDEAGQEALDAWRERE